MAGLYLGTKSLQRQSFVLIDKRPLYVGIQESLSMRRVGQGPFWKALLCRKQWNHGEKYHSKQNSIYMQVPHFELCCFSVNAA